jgi:hypothetical protein
MYNSDRLFGDIFILLICDFIQLSVTTGRDLWSVMYDTVNGDDATAQNLFQHIHVHEYGQHASRRLCNTYTGGSGFLCASTGTSHRTLTECQKQRTLQTHHPGRSGWCHT